MGCCNQRYASRVYIYIYMNELPHTTKSHYHLSISKTITTTNIQQKLMQYNIVEDAFYMLCNISWPFL